MGEPWVKVFLKNGQFETANKNRSRNQDHVYQYLVSKYKNIFQIPQSPKRKPSKSKPKLRLKTKSLNNKSIEIKRYLHVEQKQRSCLRCCQKSSNQLNCKKGLTPKTKKTQPAYGKRRRMSQLLKENQIDSGRLNYSMTTRPISLSTFNKRAGFIRKAIETPVQELISSERGGLRI